MIMVMTDALADTAVLLEAAVFYGTDCRLLCREVDRNVCTDCSLRTVSLYSCIALGVVHDDDTVVEVSLPLG